MPASASACAAAGALAAARSDAAAGAAADGARHRSDRHAHGRHSRRSSKQKLAAFEQRKGAQIALLIVPTTQPEAIEQYSIRVADAWKLGREDTDDGVLLLVALQDRALRIEVGYGLEGVLPDAIARRIIDDTIKPLFRQGDIYGGVSAGLAADHEGGRRRATAAARPQVAQAGRPAAGLLPVLFFGVLIGGARAARNPGSHARCAGHRRRSRAAWSGWCPR